MEAKQSPRPKAQSNRAQPRLETSGMQEGRSGEELRLTPGDLSLTGPRGRKSSVACVSVKKRPGLSGKMKVQLNRLRGRRWRVLVASACV